MDFYTSVYNTLFYVYFIWKKFSRIFGKRNNKKWSHLITVVCLFNGNQARITCKARALIVVLS